MDLLKAFLVEKFGGVIVDWSGSERSVKDADFAHLVELAETEIRRGKLSPDDMSRFSYLLDSAKTELMSVYYS